MAASFLSVVVEASPDQDLQERIRKHARDWSVQVEHAAETETSVLLFGHRHHQTVLLKVLRHRGDEWRSGEVLDAFEARAAARVYEYAEGALLFERLRPGTALVQLAREGHDDEVVERRLYRFASRLPIDRSRALSWGFAQAILSEIWKVEDGDQSAGAHGLRLAKAIRPMLA